MDRYKFSYEELLREISSSEIPLHCIYYDWHLDIRAGGPTGYLANLQLGLSRIEKSTKCKIWFAVRDKVQGTCGKSGVKDFFLKIPGFPYMYCNYLSVKKRKEQLAYIEGVKNIKNELANTKLLPDELLKRVKAIHTHTVADLLKVSNLLDVKGIKGVKLILTSHTPESVADEYYNQKKLEGYSEKNLDDLYNAWREIELLAYQKADIVIAPSKDALEPARIVLGDQFINNKLTRFVETGAEAISSNLTKSEARKKYGVKTQLVIGYLGRHNHIKGYDVLKIAAQNILKEYPDVTFLIAGDLGKGKYAPLNHPRWIECGRVNPADFLPALDLFVLPNRQTYYDLAFLEVMSQGIPIICSRTGGNISLAKDVRTTVTYDDGSQELEMAIKNTLKDEYLLSRENSEYISNVYLRKFTLSEFARRYQLEVENIILNE